MNETGQLKTGVQLIAGIAMLGLCSLAYPASLAAQFPSVFDEPPGDEVYICSIKCEHLGAFIQAASPISFYFKRCSSWVTRSPFKFVVPLVISAGFIPFLVVLSTKTMNYDMAAGVMSPSVLEYKAYHMVQEKFLSAQMDGFPVLMKATPVGNSLAASAVCADCAASAAVVASDASVASALSLDVSMLQVAIGLMNIQPSETTFAKSIALSPEFGKMACRFATTLMEMTRGTDYEIRSTDLDGMWWNASSGTCIETPLNPSRSHQISLDGTSHVTCIHDIQHWVLNLRR